MPDAANQDLVEILLATYNGERFLRAQIDSILAQDYPNLRVLARDDGSTDQTVPILHEYAQRYPDRFRLMPPSPSTRSAQGNFLLLLQASTADFVCLSDQDDVWLPGKISQTKYAMDHLEARWGASVPLLVFSDLHIVDDQLRTLHPSFWAHKKIDPERIHRLPPLLVQNVVTGSTAMLNRRLVELSLRMPPEAMMHDHWIALLASTFGRSAILKNQTVLYRQHDRNVLGAGQNTRSLSDLRQRLRRSNTRETEWEKSQQQAEAFLRMHGAQLSASDRRLLQLFQPRGTSRSRAPRILNMLRYGFHRVGFSANLLMVFDLWIMNPR
jgi:glycosyltransferase involved in cell wall biosynthesis